jgi:hypothetical protein
VQETIDELQRAFDEASFAKGSPGGGGGRPGTSALGSGGSGQAGSSHTAAAAQAQSHAHHPHAHSQAAAAAGAVGDRGQFWRLMASHSNMLDEYTQRHASLVYDRLLAKRGRDRDETKRAGGGGADRDPLLVSGQPGHHSTGGGGSAGDRLSSDPQTMHGALIRSLREQQLTLSPAIVIEGSTGGSRPRKVRFGVAGRAGSALSASVQDWPTPADRCVAVFACFLAASPLLTVWSRTAAPAAAL